MDVSATDAHGNPLLLHLAQVSMLLLNLIIIILIIIIGIVVLKSSQKSKQALLTFFVPQRALKPIKKGEEVLVSYGYNFWARSFTEASAV
jgi:hypothetical protein